jgi:hypothetical protein
MSGAVKFDKWLNDDNSENYKCRAWVNFNGTGTVAIRASGNVSSITDNGAGNYTVNFTTAMPDADYAPIANAKLSLTADRSYTQCTNLTVTTFRIIHYEQNTQRDTDIVTASVTR